MSELRQMLPSLTAKYSINSGYTHAVLWRETRSRQSLISMATTYVRNLLVSKFSPDTGFASRLMALVYSVGDVIFSRAKKQVVRIYAGWIIALVANHPAIWDRTIVDNVRDAMGATFPKTVNAAVTILVFSALPFPAFVWRSFVNLLPKAFSLCFLCVTTMTLDESNWLTFDIAEFRMRLSRNRGWLTATAHAHSARIGRFLGQISVIIAMTLNESNWFALYPSVSLAALRGDGCLLAAATMTVAVRNVVRGMIEGHQDLQFWCLIRGRFLDAARYFYLHSTPPLYHEGVQND